MHMSSLIVAVMSVFVIRHCLVAWCYILFSIVCLAHLPLLWDSNLACLKKRARRDSNLGLPILISDSAGILDQSHQLQIVLVCVGLQHGGMPPIQLVPNMPLAISPTVSSTTPLPSQSAIPTQFSGLLGQHNSTNLSLVYCF